MLYNLLTDFNFSFCYLQTGCRFWLLFFQYKVFALNKLVGWIMRPLGGTNCTNNSHWNTRNYQLEDKKIYICFIYLSNKSFIYTWTPVKYVSLNIIRESISFSIVTYIYSSVKNNYYAINNPWLLFLTGNIRFKIVDNYFGDKISKVI